ncbi:MAG: hypothetical protein IJU10_04240 [Clostridia bacterium]|nr:hypothetical protein [Clostridia bacterium]
MRASSASIPPCIAGAFSKKAFNSAKFLKELITWGRKNGMAGIRPWAPELDWANPWFDFDNQAKTATAKQVLFDALKESVQ